MRNAIADVLSDTIEKLAYTEVTVSNDCPQTIDCARGVSIEVSGHRLMVALTPAFAQVLYDGHTGTQEASSADAQVDVLKELANILAGRLFTVIRDGGEPCRISIPVELSTPEISARWEPLQSRVRLLLSADGMICGGLSLDTPGVLHESTPHSHADR